MKLFPCVTFLWISVIVYVDFGLCQTVDNVNKFKSISVSVDMNSDGIQENELFIFKRPTKPTTSKPVQLPSGTTTTASPQMTTTLAQLKKKGAVRRTFKIKQTFIKRFYPKRVFSPDYFKFIRRFRWEDFQRRKKNNRCPWC